MSEIEVKLPAVRPDNNKAIYHECTDAILQLRESNLDKRDKYTLMLQFLKEARGVFQTEINLASARCKFKDFDKHFRSVESKKFDT